MATVKEEVPEVWAAMVAEIVETNVLARHRGCLLGLATGDALGTTLEFRRPGTFTPIDDLIGGGPFDLPAGAWTDDTSMALCLADSLLEKSGFDARHQMELYCRWYRQGYRSATGRCFDIGNATRAALHIYEQTGVEFAGSKDEMSAGNGCLMRLAPVAMFWSRNHEQALDFAELSSRTTHGAPECLDACRHLASLIVAALAGASKAEILATQTVFAISPALREVIGGSYLRRQPPEIRGSGYVVESLEAALWAFAHSQSFREGALMAVNLGEDADTTGAIYGQLAGAYYGEQGIPNQWLEKLVLRDEIGGIAERLAQGPQ